MDKLTTASTPTELDVETTELPEVCNGTQDQEVIVLDEWTSLLTPETSDLPEKNVDFAAYGDPQSITATLAALGLNSDSELENLEDLKAALTVMSNGSKRPDQVVPSEQFFDTTPLENSYDSEKNSMDRVEDFSQYRSNGQCSSAHLMNLVRDTRSGLSSGFSPQGRSSRQHNFDLRNVDTFGKDAVRRHTLNQPTQASNRHSSYVPAKSPQGSSTEFFQNSSLETSDLRDPRTRDMFQDLIVQNAEAKRGLSVCNCSKVKSAQADSVFESIVTTTEEILDKIIDSTPNIPEGLKEHPFIAYLPSRVKLFSAERSSRRLLMRSLSILSRDPSCHSLALRVFTEMLASLDTLLTDDKDDMIYGNRWPVFQRIVSQCTLDEVCLLAGSLLKAHPYAIRSKMGLFLIGALMDRANSLDYVRHKYWLSTYMPRIVSHLESVDKKYIEEYVGHAGIRHLSFFDIFKFVQQRGSPADVANLNGTHASM